MMANTQNLHQKGRPFILRRVTGHLPGIAPLLHLRLYQTQPLLPVLYSGVAGGKMRTMKALPSNASCVVSPRPAFAEVRFPPSSPITAAFIKS
jgi:hypothetical protein